LKDYFIICSADEDQAFADRLKADLQGAELSIWGGGGRPGSTQKYAVGVADAIKTASGFICIASGCSVRSSMIKIEMNAAHRAGVPIYLVALDESGYRAMTKAAKSVTKIDSRQNYKQAVTDLVEILKGPSVTDEGEQGTIGTDGYVFLSYAEADTPYMEEVKKFLSGKGYGYWEFQGSSRDYQSNLAMELEKILSDAVATLTILSPAWKESKWSLKEFMYSQQVGKPTFLLRFEDVEPTLAIADILYIDFVEDKVLGFQRLDQKMKSIFNEFHSRAKK